MKPLICSGYRSGAEGIRTLGPPPCKGESIMLRSFPDVQKLLQISIFFLESGRLCSLLFAWVSN